MLLPLAVVTVVAGLLLTLCERLWPAIPEQPLIRRGFVTDLGYWLGMAPLSQLISAAALSGLSVAAATMLPWLPKDQPWFASTAPHIAALPAWLQILLGLILFDFATYWGHRWTHGDWLWPYHAVHHASHDLDWLSTARVHPFQMFFMKALQGSLLIACGYPASSLIFFFICGTVSSYLLHANLPWSYGPLRYVLTSPALHRWHHSPEDGMRDKNFALIFSFLDVMFGTYHMPERPAPKECGGADWMPQNLLGQIFSPMRQTWAAVADSRLGRLLAGRPKLGVTS